METSLPPVTNSGRKGKEGKEEEHIEERGGTVTGRGTRRTRVRKQLGPLDF